MFSLVHNGPGPKFLSNTLFTSLLGDIELVEPNLDVADDDVNNEIGLIEACEDLESLQNLIANSKLSSLIGYDFISSVEEKHEVVRGT